MKRKMMPFGWKPQALKVTWLLKGQTEENQRPRFIVPQTVWWDRSTLHRYREMLCSSTSKMFFFSNCSFHFFKGLSDYVDDDLIQATSRELRSAMNVSPGALNAAVQTLVKRKPSGKVTIPINLLSSLFSKCSNPTNSNKQHLSVSQMSKFTRFWPYLENIRAGKYYHVGNAHKE